MTEKIDKKSEDAVNSEQLSRKALISGIQKILRCPVCKSKVTREEDQFLCTDCGARFPVVDEIPVLLNEENSIFSFKDFTLKRQTTFDVEPKQGVVKILLSAMPDIGRNWTAEENYMELVELLETQTTRPRILIIGCGIVGKGLQILMNMESAELVETDVALGMRTNLVCDAHDIPFADGSFDAVVVQAVLEHVVDPFRCVEEIHRVLKDDGLVYADTPFMQQVHFGRYDFTRFTHLGHRRLFRKFEEINSGISCGPGMSLAWSIQYFLLSFTTNRTLRRLIVVFVSFTSFFLKYFDYYLIKKTAAIDAASSFYFTGRKSDDVLSDRELIKQYRGAI